MGCCTVQQHSWLRLSLQLPLLLVFVLLLYQGLLTGQRSPDAGVHATQARVRPDTAGQALAAPIHQTIRVRSENPHAGDNKFHDWLKMQHPWLPSFVGSLRPEPAASTYTTATGAMSTSCIDIFERIAAGSGRPANEHAAVQQWLEAERCAATRALHGQHSLRAALRGKPGPPYIRSTMQMYGVSHSEKCPCTGTPRCKATGYTAGVTSDRDGGHVPHTPSQAGAVRARGCRRGRGRLGHVWEVCRPFQTGYSPLSYSGNPGDQ